MNNTVRDYELVLITGSQLDEQALEALHQRVNGWIAAGGGTLTGTNVWGRRPLAYEVSKHNDGIYVQYNFQLPTQATRELERNLRIDEQIIRHLVVRLDEK